MQKVIAMMYQKIQPGSIIKCTKGNRVFSPGEILKIEKRVFMDDPTAFFAYKKGEDLSYTILVGKNTIFHTANYKDAINNECAEFELKLKQD